MFQKILSRLFGKGKQGFVNFSALFLIFLGVILALFITSIRNEISFDDFLFGLTIEVAGAGLFLYMVDIHLRNVDDDDHGALQKDVQEIKLSIEKINSSTDNLSEELISLKSQVEFLANTIQESKSRNSLWKLAKKIFRLK